MYNIPDPIPKLFQILENQENRGKDATGIAYLENGQIKIIKEAIEPKKFISKYKNTLNGLSSLVFIGHNRAASTNIHEAHKDSEAHPFISEDKSFALIHNGTLYNYDFLRCLVDDLGHKRSSGVDSELFVHLLEELLKRYKREEAIWKFLKYTEGNIIILFNDGTLYGIPAKSFIMAKPGDSQYIIASELASLRYVLDDVKEIKVFIPAEDKALLKISIDKDGKPSAILWGEWTTTQYKYQNWKVHSTSLCDFCKQYKPCEKIEYNGRAFDRCLECYKAGKKPEDLLVNRTKETENVIVIEPEKPKDAPKTVKGVCQKCFAMYEIDYLVFCTKCKRHFCIKCIADHDHYTKYKSPNETGAYIS